MTNKLSVPRYAYNKEMGAHERDVAALESVLTVAERLLTSILDRGVESYTYYEGGTSYSADTCDALDAINSVLGAKWGTDGLWPSDEHDLEPWMDQEFGEGLE